MKAQEKKTSASVKKSPVILLMLSLIIMVTISVMIGGGVLKFGFLSIFFEKDLVANSQGIDIDPEEKCIFNIYNNNIIVSKNSVIEAMDKNGEIKWDIPISFSNVSMDINGDYALVADIGDKEAILIYNGEVKTNIQTQEPIIMAKLNSNGYFALITEEKGYNGRIIAYSPEGTELFTNYSVNHIVDVDISNDNKLMAMCTLDSSSGEVSGSITFYHLNNDQPYSGIVLEDTLLASIKYYRDRLIAIGDDKVVGFDLKGIKDWELEFETEEIIGFDVTSDNMIVIITKEKRVGGFFSNNIVKIIDIAGNIRGTYDVGGSITSLDVLDDIIALGIKREICLLNSRGELKAETEFSKDIVQLGIFNNKRALLVVSRNMLDVMQIK